MQFGKFAVFGLIGAAAVAGLVAAVRMQGPPAVEVVTPERRNVTESVAVTGELRGLTETNVGAQISGRIAGLQVKEGDHVRRGQPIAQLDDSTLQTALAQAEQAYRVAEGEVEQAADAIKTASAQRALAARPTLASDIARQKADTAQNVAVARAKLLASRQRLAELLSGDTAEEREQLSAQIAQAQVTLDLAEKEFGRQRELYRQGALAASAFDSADSARLSAREALAQFKARQKQQQVGTRKETLEQARADVRAAEATIAGAQATGAAQLQTLLAQPRAEDVLVADSRIREARRTMDVAILRKDQAAAARELARRQRGEAVVNSPFEGTVTKILTEVGGVTAPNQPIVRLVRTGRPEVRADMDEKYLGRVQVGQQAIVTSDAFPGKQVKSRIRELGSQIDNTRGTVEVRLDLLEKAEWLRPNQTLSVNILVGKDSPRYLLPIASVISAGGTTWAYAVENGVVVKKVLDTDATAVEGVPVKSGLTESDQIVLNPNGVQPGAKVRPVAAKNPGKGS